MSLIIVVLIALSAVAVLAGVAFVVMGKGGELARFEADHPPLDLPADRPLSGSDVSRVLLPLALWGYHVRAVDDVLRRVVGALSERDARIADLERRLQEAGQPASASSASADTAVLGTGGGPAARPGASGAGGMDGPEAPARRTGAHAHTPQWPDSAYAPPRSADQDQDNAGDTSPDTGETGDTGSASASDNTDSGADSGDGTSAQGTAADAAADPEGAPASAATSDSAGAPASEPRERHTPGAAAPQPGTP